MCTVSSDYGISLYYRSHIPLYIPTVDSSSVLYTTDAGLSTSFSSFETKYYRLVQIDVDWITVTFDNAVLP